jgi:hypothetical protein
MLPPEHLHHATAVRPQVVHSHLPALPRHSSAHRPCLLTSEDDDHDAVSLDGLTMSRAPMPSAFVPGLVPDMAWRSPATVSSDSIVASEPQASESPPQRSTPSRAPPAC